MGLFSRNPNKQSSRERNAMRDHLEELEELREEQLDVLGQMALDMSDRGSFDRDLLSSKAAEVAGIDREADLVARGLEEGLTLEQLEDLARQGAGEPGGRDS